MPGCCFGYFAGSVQADLFSTASHCAWRHFISLSNSDKETKQRKRLQPLILKWPERAVLTVWDFGRTLGAKPRTLETLPLRQQIPTRFATSVGSRQRRDLLCENSYANERSDRTAIVVFCAGPRSLVAKRVDVGIRRGRVSSVDGCGVERFSEVPNSGNCTLGTLKNSRLEGVFFASFLCRCLTKK